MIYLFSKVDEDSLTEGFAYVAEKVDGDYFVTDELLFNAEFVKVNEEELSEKFVAITKEIYEDYCQTLENGDSPRHYYELKKD